MDKKSQVIKYISIIFIVALILIILIFLFYTKEDVNIDLDNSYKSLIEYKILYSCFSNKEFEINIEEFFNENLKECLGLEGVFLRISLHKKDEVGVKPLEKYEKIIYLNEVDFNLNKIFCDLPNSNLFCNLKRNEYLVEILEGEKKNLGKVKIDIIIKK